MTQTCNGRPIMLSAVVGKQETIYLRVDAQTAAAIDAARGTSSRARWVAGLIDAALVPKQDTSPVEFTPDTAPTVITDPTVATVPRDRTETTGTTAPCSHPRARVIKNFCYRCGRMVPVK